MIACAVVRRGCTKARCWIAPRKWKQHCSSQTHMQAVQRVGQGHPAVGAEACRVEGGYGHIPGQQQQQQQQQPQQLHHQQQQQKQGRQIQEMHHQHQQLRMPMQAHQQAQMQQIQQMQQTHPGGPGTAGAAQMMQRQLDQLQQFLLLHQQTTQQGASTESKRACISFGQEAVPAAGAGLSEAGHDSASSKASQLGEGARERWQPPQQQQVRVSYQQSLRANAGGDWHDKLQQLQHENEALKGRVRQTPNPQPPTINQKPSTPAQE